VRAWFLGLPGPTTAGAPPRADACIAGWPLPAAPIDLRFRLLHGRWELDHKCRASNAEGRQPETGGCKRAASRR
jgi:hypothetical protein